MLPKARGENALDGFPCLLYWGFTPAQQVADRKAFAAGLHRERREHCSAAGAGAVALEGADAVVAAEDAGWSHLCFDTHQWSLQVQ